MLIFNVSQFRCWHYIEEYKFPVHLLSDLRTLSICNDTVVVSYVSHAPISKQFLLQDQSKQKLNCLSELLLTQKRVILRFATVMASGKCKDKAVSMLFFN
jgi:hypothetical protein